MNSPTIPSIQHEFDLMNQQNANKIPPERAAILRARREQLIATNLADGSLKNGEVAPDFTLPDAFGKSVTLSELLTQGPVVVTFYRGDWCPYCNVTLRAYEAILPQIKALGGALVAVSPQDADHTLLTVEHKQLTYPVLSDRGNVVARRYRLVWTVPVENRAAGVNLPEFNGDEAWELPMSGTFVIDQSGVVTVAYVKEDWIKRLEPGAILDSLQQLTHKVTSINKETV